MAAPMEDDELLETDDYYAWLGLGHDATKEEITNAYRRLCRIYHPDKHAGSEKLISKAEQMFAKISKAHDVLSNPHSKAIYDTVGIKGLETDGWEIVSRQKTPAELIEEYERLQREREERLLQQKTNPKGTIMVQIDATDVFERYRGPDGLEYRTGLPHIEISQMTISQSVECPLTTKNTATLGGNINAAGGTGGGAISGSFRRLTSSNGWLETELSAGNGLGWTIRGFRNLWARSYGTMSLALQQTKRGGVRPVANTMVAMQLDKNLQGRLGVTFGAHSAVNTMIVYDTERHHVLFNIQLGIPNSFVGVTYVLRFPDHDCKVKVGGRVGTFGSSVEYACEKKITQFSTLGASMSVGVPSGILLKIKLVRGTQHYIFPIQLSEEIIPNAIFYGTVFPIAAYFVIDKLLVKPFLQKQSEEEIKRRKDANSTRMTAKKQEAETAVELMKETVDRIIEQETSRKGLVIQKAVFGKLESDDVNDCECIDVTVPTQALVKDSQLHIAQGTHFSELPGFYDPCVGEKKTLSITYYFREKLHLCKYQDGKRIKLPKSEDLYRSSNGSSSGSEAKH